MVRRATQYARRWRCWWLSIGRTSSRILIAMWDWFGEGRWWRYRWGWSDEFTDDEVTDVSDTIARRSSVPPVIVHVGGVPRRSKGVGHAKEDVGVWYRW